MEKHKDMNRNFLEKGKIYRGCGSGQFLYFTGKYNKYDEACFENLYGDRVDLPSSCSTLLRRLDEKEIRKNIRWLEKGLE